MVRRRRRGSGGLGQRADGLWVGQVSVGAEDGKRIRRSFSSKVKGEVEFWLREQARAGEYGERAATSRRRVSDYLADWLESVSPTIRSTTARGYEIHVRRWIEPAIGDVALIRLRPADVVRVRDRVSRAGRSARTAQSVLTTLRMALEAAVRAGEIERNPATGVRAPSVVRREAHPMSPEEARAILAAFDGNRLEALVATALGSGLRLGELLGLRWADLTGDRLTVRGSVRPLPAEEHRGYVLTRVEPKTRRSGRTIHLPAFAVAALGEQRRRQAEVAVRPYIFTTSSGAFLDPRNTTKAFQLRLREAGIEPIRFHDLRHGYATLMLGSGVPLRVISEALGHTSIALTAAVYAHVLPSLQADAAAKLDEVLGG